jgi:hypothetical protein
MNLPAQEIRVYLVPGRTGRPRLRAGPRRLAMPCRIRRRRLQSAALVGVLWI